MKFRTLKNIVTEEISNRELLAEYTGNIGDDSADKLSNELKSFELQLQNKYDLKPSELYLLNDVEIGEPSQFKTIIRNKKKTIVEDYDLDFLLERLKHL